VKAPPSPPPAEANSAADKTGLPDSAAAPSESYEKLVANGDRALENGSNSKAKDFYQRALRLRPAGTQAISGLGFVALDLGQIPAAYEQFKRALAINPSLGSAVFGMAEIHRARGEKALALQSYKRYLQISPKGSEAAAARRQVSALQPAPQAEPQPAPQPEGE
jgi:tetratricopeptide (TPR) repeat protein